MKRKVIILKTGSARVELRQQFGDFEDWILAGLPADLPGVDVLDVRQPGFQKTDPGHSLVIITGSHDNVTDQPFYLSDLCGWLQSAVARNVPLLGICYGHQLLASAFGGRVDFNSKGIELGTVQLNLLPEAAADPLFSPLPKQFLANVSHSQSVLEIPAGATVLAASVLEAVQAFRLKPAVYGFQFHPEFTLPIMRAYVQLKRGQIDSNSQDIETILAGIKPTPLSFGLIADFYRLFGQSD